MIFISGFVHSDPHPGNILVKKDPEDKEVTVYLLDHGLYAVSCNNRLFLFISMWWTVKVTPYKFLFLHALWLWVHWIITFFQNRLNLVAVFYKV